jgi:death-on-curing protein
VTGHITLEQALRIARRAVGGPIEVRDLGLLDAAVNRPRATVFGQDAYAELLDKAAALLHSLARNHPLVDGNKRLAWLGTYVFCAKNGVELDPDDDDAYALVVSVAAGEIDDVTTIASRLAAYVKLSRREAIRRTSGSLTGSFGADELERRREDWPN